MSSFISNIEDMEDSTQSISETGLCRCCRSIFALQICGESRLVENNNRKSGQVLPHHLSILEIIKVCDSGCRLCDYVLGRISLAEQIMLGFNLELGSPIQLPERQISYTITENERQETTCHFKFLALNGKEIKKNFAFASLSELANNANDIDGGNHDDDRNASDDNSYSGNIRPLSLPVLPVSGISANLGISPRPGIEHSYSKRSEYSLNQAREWICDCLNNHDACYIAEKSQKLPTRLIWVGSTEADIARLCGTKELNTSLRKIQYMTLSHCWGTIEFLKLTTDSIDEFRAALPMKRLRKVFQDAISVTRSMGQSYLWIDSLCIIQQGDQMKDWEKESLKISRVYSNSFCNIAATRELDDEQGLFTERSHSILIPPIISISRLDSSERNYLFHDGTYQCLDLDLWNDEITKTTLLSRAWVFKERMLAPRVLHSASSQLFFECRTSQASEDYPQSFVADDHWPETAAKDLQLKIISTNPIGTDELIDSRAMDSWIELVNIYSGCHLSYESDRLFAVSGLAEHMKASNKWPRYEAGLWADSNDHLIDQLCWKRVEVHKTSNIYIAPSWSWASGLGKISMACRSIKSNPNSDNEGIETFRPTTKFLGIGVVAGNADPMGRIYSSQLRLEGPLYLIIFDTELCEKRASWNIKSESVFLSLWPDAMDDNVRLVGPFCVAKLKNLVYGNSTMSVAQVLLLKAAGNTRGEYRRVALATWYAGSPREADNALETMTEDMYEKHDEETDMYTFTVI